MVFKVSLVVSVVSKEQIRRV